jgi:hypothetical protein
MQLCKPWAPDGALSKVDVGVLGEVPFVVEVMARIQNWCEMQKG